MPNIYFDGKQYSLTSDETILDGLLRHKLDIPHNCKAGACQCCLMQSDSQNIPTLAQQGLKPNQKALGLFLSCSCRPTEDLTVQLANQESEKYSSSVIDIREPNKNILCIRLEAPFDFFAGQYINIWHKKSIIRSYSIASLPSDGFIELHVKVIENGRFSAWAKNNLNIGDTLTIQGPIGDCIYTNDALRKPLLLIAIGTGLAPLYGILKNALQLGHSGPIHLVLGARNAKDFYLCSELQSLSKQHPHFTITFVAQNGENPQIEAGNLQQKDLYQYVKEQHPEPKNTRIYLCGAATFVTKMKKQCFLAGAAMSEIHSDIFLPSQD